MTEEVTDRCSICGREFSADSPSTPYAEAGEWLAAEVWHDEGRLCPTCLESRARLAMMYLHDKNT